MDLLKNSLLKRVILCILLSLISFIFTYLSDFSKVFIYDIKVSMSLIAEKPFNLQIFYAKNADDGFSENNSLIKKLVPDINDLEITIDSLSEISRLRIDFGSDPGVILVSNIKVSGDNDIFFSLDNTEEYSYNQLYFQERKNGLSELNSNLPDPFVQINSPFNIKSKTRTLNVIKTSCVLFLYFILWIVLLSLIEKRKTLILDIIKNKNSPVPVKYNLAMHHFRAVAILFIVIVHFSLSKDTIISDTVYSIQDSLFKNSSFFFAFISGYLFYLIEGHKLASVSFSSFASFYKKKIKNVYFPMLFVSLIITIIYYLTKRNTMMLLTDFSDDTLNFVIVFLSGKIQPQFWYIPFCMCMFVLCPIYLKLKGLILKITFFILMVLPLVVERGYDNYVLYRSLCYFGPVFIMGIEFCRHEDNVYAFIRNSRVSILSTFVIFQFFICYCTYTQLDGMIYIDDDSYLISKFAICHIKNVAAMLIMVDLLSLIKCKIYFLDVIARYSFTIYFLHMFIGYGFVLPFVDKVLPNENHLISESFLIGALNVSLSVILSIVIGKAIKLGFNKWSRSMVGC